MWRRGREKNTAKGSEEIGLDDQGGGICWWRWLYRWMLWGMCGKEVLDHERYSYAVKVMRGGQYPCLGQFIAVFKTWFLHALRQMKRLVYGQ